MNWFRIRVHYLPLQNYVDVIVKLVIEREYHKLSSIAYVLGYARKIFFVVFLLLGNRCLKKDKILAQDQ